MDIPFDNILSVVREPGDLKFAFGALREIGRSRMPSEVWDKIRTPEVEADVWNAAAWLKESIFEFRPSGVYLGLDTLNENHGDGKNVEIGMTHAADPAKLEMEWAYSLPERGESHLIEGIYKTHRSYQKFGLGYDSGQLADWLFFFGYSGLVLAAAVELIAVNWDCLFIWGFHDGDLGYLARSSSTGITRLAIVGQGEWVNKGRRGMLLSLGNSIVESNAELLGPRKIKFQSRAGWGNSHRRRGCRAASV